MKDVSRWIIVLAGAVLLAANLTVSAFAWQAQEEKWKVFDWGVVVRVKDKCGVITSGKELDDQDSPRQLLIDEHEGIEVYELKAPSDDLDGYGLSDYGLAFMEFEDTTPFEENIAGLSGTTEGQILHMECYMGGTVHNIRDVKVLGAEEGRNPRITELKCVGLDAEGEIKEDVFVIPRYPAALLDEDGNLAGLCVSKDVLISFETDVDKFYKSKEGTEEEPEEKSEEEPKEGGGLDKDLLTGGIIGGIAGGGGAVINMIKKKKKKTEPELEPQQKSEPEPEPEEYGPTTPYRQPVPDPETVSVSRTTPAPEPVPATETVIAISGSLRGIAYPVGTTPLNFGRDPSCGVCLPLDTKGVSRMHCQMYRNENGRLMLMDCGSTYGTYVAGMGKLTANVAVEVGVGVPFYLGSDQVGFMVQRS